MEQELAESQLKGQLESATQQAEQYKVISFVLLIVHQFEILHSGTFWYFYHKPLRILAPPVIGPPKPKNKANSTTIDHVTHVYA